MRVLHASFQRNWTPGIAVQVKAEQEAANQLSIPWVSRLFSVHPEEHRGETIVGPVGRTGGGARNDYYRWLDAQVADFDLLLLRHTSAAVDQALFVNRLRIPFYLVHHSPEGPELAAERSLKGRGKMLIEYIAGRASLHRCAGIIAVTPEIADYERCRGLRPNAPAHIYPNGTLAEDDQIQSDDRVGDIPVLLFVASHFVPWHGLDRLLQAARSCEQPFVMHVVGEVGAVDLQSAERDPRFVIHGMLDRAGISRLISESWLGLSSFALDRKQVTMACTLKVREYLASGLPVYANHADVFDNGFQYYINGPCDLNSILNTARRARSWSRRDVALAARPYIDKRQLLRKLYSALVV